MEKAHAVKIIKAKVELMESVYRECGAKSNHIEKAIKLLNDSAKLLLPDIEEVAVNPVAHISPPPSQKEV